MKLLTKVQTGYILSLTKLSLFTLTSITLNIQPGWGQQTFNYTGSPQIYIVPCGVTSISITAYGAQGSVGYIGGAAGGLGGKAEATITVTPGETLSVYVGGSNGYNGGGIGGNGPWGNGGNGGGASDVRRNALFGSRIIVAGGGGGGGWGGGRIYTGGTGGGNIGGTGNFNGAGGGTQSAGGTIGPGTTPGTAGQLGIGGNGGDRWFGGGGGGGGYYGGGGAGGWTSGGGGGGGGSSYLTGTNTSTVSGVQSGNGKIIISTVTSVISFLPFITGTDTLCSTHTSTLTANGGKSYLWKNTGDTTATITITPLKDTTYFVTVTDSNNCKKDASVFITVNPSPDAVITGTTALCKNSSTILTAFSAQADTSYKYKWSTNDTTTTITVKPDSTTMYWVAVSNKLCTDTAVLTVQVTKVIAVISGDTILCKGSSTIFTASGGTSYLWNTGDTITSIIRKPSADTTYSVIVSENSCRDTVTVAITVNIPIANAGKDITICPNNSVQLNANGGMTYQWTSSQDLSNDTVSNPIAKPGSTTSYIVKVTDSNACIAYDTILVTVDTSLPVPQFTPKDLTGEAPLTVNFNNTTIGGSSYIWRFENESISDKINPSYTYTSAGTYPVMLIAYNSNGCADTAYGNIQIQDNGSELWVPNAFTPDEDGLNDLFGAKSTGIIEFQGMIFNRWGELLYEWDKVNGGWDGKYRNQEVPSGVYVYVVKAKGADNVIYKKTGHVALLR